MSDRRRANRIVGRLTIAVIIAVMALIFSVWLVSARARSDLEASNAGARAAQTNQLRAGCARSVARDFELLATNRDLAGFARDAAKTRRDSGQIGVARRYEARARDAEDRVAAVSARLPSEQDSGSVSEFCRKLFPEPTDK